MISKRMEEEINKQINAEMYSAYLYLSMSAYFESQSLPGFANWMRVQYQEENFHAMKFFDYLHERGGEVKLMPIEGPQTEWKDAIEVFEQVFKHEQHVTSLINNLVNVAIEEKDHASNAMLQWFVEEQVEEEASADQILQDLKIIGAKGHGLLMMDRELRQRQFNEPAAEANGE